MRLIITILCLFTCALCKAQVNLVFNPSFEEYTQCPSAWDQIKYATHWNGIDTTWSPGDSIVNTPPCLPEFCHVCATTHFAIIPTNDYFYQYPRTGNGLAQVQMYFDESFNGVVKRDYLQGRLFQPLENGKSYCVVFYVNLAEASGYAVNHIGAYLDNGMIDTTGSCGLPQTQYTPQIVTQNIINDTENWVKIEGSFVAQGGERFITIGNFYDKANTGAIDISVDTHANYTWYLVDDVSVIESDLPAYAGEDRAITAGDSTYIGRPPEVGLGCVWRTISGDSVGSGGGIWVKPVQTTGYVVAQTLCGVTRYDTVTVYVWNAGLNNVPYDKGFTIAPNPVKNMVSVKSALYTNEAARMIVYDMSGREVMDREITFSKGVVPVPVSLVSGVYMVELTDKRGGKFLQRMIVQ